MRSIHTKKPRPKIWNNVPTTTRQKLKPVGTVAINLQTGRHQIRAVHGISDNLEHGY